VVDGPLTTFLGGRWSIDHVPSLTGRTSAHVVDGALTTFFGGQWTIDHIAAGEKPRPGEAAAGE